MLYFKPFGYVEREVTGMSEKEKQEIVEEETLSDEIIDKETINNEASENEETQNNEDEKVKALQVELDNVSKEKEDLYQKVLRVQADFDNFRRRTKKEKENDLKYKSQELAMELLPVVDNFERALQVEIGDDVMKNFVEGMNMIYRQLTTALDKAGIEEIPAEGEPFDPNLHQAVMQVNEEDKESNTVVEVLQKGYKLKDRVIRPAMVKVNQ
ncbi:nucleotide exchange factor GrpE [Salirhabdus sp. Marseille-P4669]|uniref:nucleotide exchange factor GrpE n=1 Tax=Salirhabdus sp. Marseille-P4669 TaxID=2042310 RepID=UPI001F2F39E9|nr:nucleotide exchange factor GrpE [Salirhabdus sp. Marseille-P4669]